MSPIPTHYRRSLSLGGLRKQRELRAAFNAETRQVAWVEGADVEPEDVEVSPEEGFNLPIFLRIAGLPLFPTTYEFVNTGEVIYHAPSPPMASVRVPEQDSVLSERAKTMQVTLTVRKLLDLGPYRGRVRTPTQQTVMGESADDHARRLIESGRLILDVPCTWHWNHLIAFSFLPTSRAQTKRNLFCGTAAANGQVANTETAIRAWVFEHDRPLGVEVTCSFLAGSHLGLRVRYRLHDRKTGGLYSEYYNPLNPQHSVYDDLDAVYDRMCDRLEGR